MSPSLALQPLSKLFRGVRAAGKAYVETYVHCVRAWPVFVTANGPICFCAFVVIIHSSLSIMRIVCCISSIEICDPQQSISTGSVIMC